MISQALVAVFEIVKRFLRDSGRLSELVDELDDVGDRFPGISSKMFCWA